MQMKLGATVFIAAIDVGQHMYVDGGVSLCFQWGPLATIEQPSPSSNEP